MSIIEKAYAKINLTLDVLAKRDDGYHEVAMIMTTLNFYDELVLTPLCSEKIIVDMVPSLGISDKNNLVYQAAIALKKYAHVTKGANIQVHKKIPAGAGLAGGSSDAAATLRGLNRLWNLGLSVNELRDIAKNIGSDVSFCIEGKTQFAFGRGEKLQKISCNFPSCFVVLAKPHYEVSTKEVYENVTPDLFARKINQENMKYALRNKNFSNICIHLENKLEQITCSKYPQVQEIKDLMYQESMEGVLMSGSGPTVFGLTQDRERANHIYSILKEKKLQVYLIKN